jgi:hypothetical protein
VAGRRPSGPVRGADGEQLGLAEGGYGSGEVGRDRGREKDGDFFWQDELLWWLGSTTRREAKAHALLGSPHSLTCLRSDDSGVESERK